MLSFGPTSRRRQKSYDSESNAATSTELEFRSEFCACVRKLSSMHISSFEDTTKMGICSEVANVSANTWSHSGLKELWIRWISCDNSVNEQDDVSGMRAGALVARAAELSSCKRDTDAEWMSVP